MSEEVVPVEEEQHRSLLGAALSMEYGPCSVAAAELSRAALRMTEQYTNNIHAQVNKYDKDFGTYLTRKYVVSELQSPQTMLALEKPIKFDDTELPFAIIQDYKTDVKPETFEVVEKHRRVLPDKMKEVIRNVKTYHPGQIWLVDRLINNRVWHPIATFEPRFDGNCSYVQLGQEITDDSVFVVQGDEQTKRLEIIDGLRKLVVATGKAEVAETVKSFIEHERERNAASLVIALGALAAQEFRTKFAPGAECGMVLVYPNGERNRIDDARRVTLSTGMKSGVVQSKLEIVKPASKDSMHPITLCATTRGNVGFPIAEFYTDTKDTRFIDADHLTDVEKYKAMIAVHALGKWHGSEETKEFLSVVGKDEGSKYTPAEFLYDLFDVDEEIKDALKPECENQEELAKVIGSKALNTCFGGTVQNVHMLTTHGSVTGNVKVERVNDAFQARIVAKPDALQGIPPTEIMSFVYDPSEPLGDRLPKGRDAYEFASLLSEFNIVQK